MFSATNSGNHSMMLLWLWGERDGEGEGRGGVWIHAQSSEFVDCKKI